MTPTVISKGIRIAQYHWDWWISRRAFKSIGRLCEGNPGFAYLLRFYLDGWIDEHPESEADKASAEDFYRSMRCKSTTAP